MKKTILKKAKAGVVITFLFLPIMALSGVPGFTCEKDDFSITVKGSVPKKTEPLTETTMTSYNKEAYLQVSIRNRAYVSKAVISNRIYTSKNIFHMDYGNGDTNIQAFVKNKSYGYFKWEEILNIGFSHEGGILDGYFYTFDEKWSQHKDYEYTFSGKKKEFRFEAKDCFRHAKYIQDYHDSTEMWLIVEGVM